MEPQVAASTIFSVALTEQGSQLWSATIDESLRIKRCMITIRKLWMSSFKYHKQHLISTSEQRVMIVQRCSVQNTRTQFSRFVPFRNFNFYPTNSHDFWWKISTHPTQHICIRFKVIWPSKFWIKASRKVGKNLASSYTIFLWFSIHFPNLYPLD